MSEGEEIGTDREAKTFLIADVRGYTRFTQQRGDAAAAVLAKRFADLARDAVEARSGHVIELRGDEALAVFEGPTQALRAALDFQATCAEAVEAEPELPLLVGVGIDSGDAVPVEGGYRGVALNMAARLCSRAVAGQVLVTKRVAGEALSLDGEVEFVDAGPASFKGFEEAVDVVQAVPGPASTTARPALSEDRDRALPPELDPLTPMVDREHEMRWLRGTWRRVRRGSGAVLFVSGPAQIGKTRLAGEIAQHVYLDGGLTNYAGPGGAATAMALSAIRDLEAAETPTLLILDDLDVAGHQVADALESSFALIAARPILVLGLIRDPAASPALSRVVEGADERGDGHRVLAPLDVAGVSGIVQLYVGDDAAEAPVESMARASQGIPGRVHEVASEWARTEASRRLAAAAEFLAAGRARHASDLGFANNVIGLKLGRLYTVGGRDVLAVERCPYQGLAAFAEEDSAYFFGRERLVGELAARTVQTGLLGVVGASGSGKSSVIGAGLIPSLRAGLLPGSATWTTASMRPGEHPMAELRAALAADGDDPLAEAVGKLPAGGRLVLVVDQFEETFTTCATQDERVAFVWMLGRAATRWSEHAAIILGIRGDYYAHCAPYPELAGELAANHVLVAPLTKEELRRTIELPARRAGLRVESDLVDALIEEVADEPGGLPLLSTAMVELWNSRDQGWIRLEAYERTGGVRGAVSRLAESSYAHLSESQREVARRVFLRLVATGEGESVTRRRVSTDEFDLERDTAAAEVLTRLTADRLLTAGGGTVEVAHEALLREWSRLQGWLEEDAQGRQLRQQLTLVSRQWRVGGREPSELYRGVRLSAAQDWSAVHSTELNELESEFLTASRQAADAEAQRQRRTNRRLRGLLAGVAVFLVVALIAGSLALVQRGNARHSATVATAQSLGAQAVSEQRIDLAMLLADEGVALDPSFRTRSDLLSTLLRVPTVIRTFHWNSNRNNGVAVSPDGRLLAIDDNDGHTVVERSGSGQRVGIINNDNLGFGPDGSLLTPAGSTGGVQVRNPETLKVMRTMAIPESVRANGASVSTVFENSRGLLAAIVTTSKLSNAGPTTTSARVVQYVYASGRVVGPIITIPAGFSTASYSLDGRRMVVVAPQVTVVWDPRTGSKLRSYSLHGGGAAVSPDGMTVAVDGGDGSVKFLDLATGHVALGIGVPSGGASGMEFTPDGATLVSVGEDGKALLWNVARHQIDETLTGHAGPIHALAISADGSTLYTGSFDSNVLAWDLTGRRGFVRSFQGADTDPSLGIWTLAISPDGKRIAIGSTTGTVNIWDAQTQRLVTTFHALPGWVTALAFGPGGRSLLVAGDRSPTLGTGSWLRVWSLGTSPRLLRTMTGIDGAILWAAWSPDGERVAAVGFERNQDPKKAGVVAGWSAQTGRVLGHPVVVNGGAPNDVAFAPRGPLVAVSGINGPGEVLDPRTGTVQSRFPNSGLYMLGVAFSPDGSTLATTGWNGAVALRNPKTGNVVASIADPNQAVVSSVAWSPDGRTIAITDWNQTLQLFDVATRRPLGPPFQLGKLASTQTWPYAAYTPTGSNVVATDATGRVWIFPASVRSWEAHACAVANRNFTRAEWNDFLAGRPYGQVCSPAPFRRVRSDP